MPSMMHGLQPAVLGIPWSQASEVLRGCTSWKATEPTGPCHPPGGSVWGIFFWVTYHRIHWKTCIVYLHEWLIFMIFINYRLTYTSFHGSFGPTKKYLQKKRLVKTP